MNVLLLGAQHKVSAELSILLAESNMGYEQLILPNLEDTLPESLFRDIGNVLPDAVFFTPQVPLSRLSFRRRLHLVDSVKKICAAVTRKNIPFLHLSSSQVYDGRLERAYTEEDKPVPSSDLAKVWRRWENTVERQFAKHLIIRPGWLLGREETYLSSEIKQAVGYHAAPNLIPQAVGNPVAPSELARVGMAILKQLNTGAHNVGVFHVAGRDVVNSVQVLTRLAPETYLRIDQQPANLNYELDCKKILNAFGVQQRAW